MDPIKIDLNDYEHTGEGANGASYNHKTDKDIMMKMYFRNFDAAALELELAKKVYAMGIPTPEPGDLVTDGKQMGIRFKRIEGKKSYSRACGDDPEHTEDYAREFARMCKKLHATHVDTTQFENVKDRFYKMLADNPDFTAEQKEKSAGLSRLPRIRTRLCTATCSSVMVSSWRKTESASSISSTWEIFPMAIICSISVWFICAAASITRNGHRR